MRRSARWFPVLLLALLLALLLGPAAALADRSAAEYYTTRGDKALKDKSYEAAEKEYRRALEEDETFRPARYGLAQALLKRGVPNEGLEQLQRFISEMKAETDPPAAWRSLLRDAERTLAVADAGSAEIQKKVDKYVRGLIALARKWEKKDPLVAERAARRALMLRPGDKKAQAILDAVDDAPKGKPLALFNGADLKGWIGAELPYFRAADGKVVAEVKLGAKQARTSRAFSGDYDISVEARIVEEIAGCDSMLALLAGLKGQSDYVGIGLMNCKVYSFDRRSDRDRKILFKKRINEWDYPYDPMKWSTYEMRFREDSITALVNGHVVSKQPRDASRFEGFVALYAQGIRVEFRKVSLQRR